MLLQPGKTPIAKEVWCAPNAGGGHTNYPPISTTTDGVSADALVWFMNGSQLSAVDGDTGKQVVTTTGAACDQRAEHELSHRGQEPHRRRPRSATSAPGRRMGREPRSGPRTRGCFEAGCVLIAVATGCSPSDVRLSVARTRLARRRRRDRRRSRAGRRDRDRGRRRRRRGRGLADAGPTRRRADLHHAGVAADVRAAEMTALPICKLSQTGCMDASDPNALRRERRATTRSTARSGPTAPPRRARSCSRAGGKIHVKDCAPDAGAAQLAECVSPTMIPNGPADTGKWVFPVGTVMIKNFLFDGKLVETRLFMHVDAATAAVIQNGTDWVGYNYAWNEQQTEATVVPNARTPVTFDTGTRNGDVELPELHRLHRLPQPRRRHDRPRDGPDEPRRRRRQSDRRLRRAGALRRDRAGQSRTRRRWSSRTRTPRSACKGRPRAPRSTRERARTSSANCGFCHRPDVNDQGFDLAPRAVAPRHRASAISRSRTASPG